jgi:hypothetical protein
VVTVHGRQLEQARKQREMSDARIRRMDLANMPAPEQCLFEAYVASDKDAHGALRDQDRLEVLYEREPGKFRYAINLMLMVGRYGYKRQNTYIMWRQYARRVFDAAVDAGNPETCVIVAFEALAEFAVQCEKRRKRMERAQARTPELRKLSAQKAANTRKHNKEVRSKFVDTDEAMKAVFATAAALADAE